MVAATLALTNCTKEIDQPNSGPESAGIPFELTASTVETKTALEGLQTVWATGDALNVFHAPAGSDQYVDDRKFTYSSDNKFKGSLSSEPSGSTDWYAFYPFGSYIVTPANTNAGYTNVWSKNGNTQNGNSDMSHLAGSNIPMYGKATVNAGEDVVVAMQHLTTVVKVVVTNTLDEELTVTNVAFTATEDVAGQYYIDFSGDEIVYTPRTGGSYVNNVAALEVSGAEALAKNETADFYIAMKPFTAQSGSKLYLSVNGTEKEITLPNDVTFNAGQIKTLTFDYDAVVLPTEITVEDFLDEEVSASKWYQIEGTISNIANTQYGNFDLEDDTGTIYVYGLLTEKGGDKGKFSTLGLKEGDILTLIGQRGVHNDSPQVVNAYYVSHESSVAAPVISCVENTVTITAEDGATIYYTTDESDPVTSATKQTYSAPFTIDETCTVKAYATATGKPQSVVAEVLCEKAEAGGPIYSYTFESKMFTTNESTVSLGTLPWTFSGTKASGVTEDFFGYDGSNGRGQQFGSSTKAYSSFTLTSNVSATVTSITINAAGAKNTTAKVTVTVNGVQYGSEEPLTKDNTEYSFNAPVGNAQSGDVVITYSQTSNIAMYIKSIKID